MNYIICIEVRILLSIVVISSQSLTIDENRTIETAKITRFDCNTVPNLSDSNESSVSCANIQEIDTSCMGDSLTVNFTKNDEEIVFQSLQMGLTLRCSKTDLQNIISFNISGNHLRNVSKILKFLGTSIKTLDLSSNFMGRMNLITLGELPELEYMNMSHMNLYEHSFGPYFHQPKLKTLDLSYNHLDSPGFLSSLSRTDIETIILDGNDLDSLHGLKRYLFPKLSLLGISNNNFTCEYLEVFFYYGFYDVRLLHTSTHKTNVRGIECRPAKPRTTTETSVEIDVQTTEKYTHSMINEVERNYNFVHSMTAVDGLSADVQMIKYLLFVMVSTLCIYFAVKSIRR